MLDNSDPNGAFNTPDGWLSLVVGPRNPGGRLTGDSISHSFADLRLGFQDSIRAARYTCQKSVLQAWASLALPHNEHVIHSGPHL